jgi:hypothetical protein
MCGQFILKLMERNISLAYEVGSLQAENLSCIRHCDLHSNKSFGKVESYHFYLYSFHVDF